MIVNFRFPTNVGAILSLLGGISLIALVGCTNVKSEQSHNSAELVDLLIHNANVLTMDPANPRTTAIAVKNNRIVALGARAFSDKYRSENVVNLDGKTIIPGFIDTHVHISGTPNHYIDLTAVASVAEITALVKAKVSELGPGQWVTGYGWSEDELVEQRKPNIEDLDAVAPNNPVVLTRAGAHSSVANSEAYKLAKITAQSPDPENGVIEKNAQGRLNGIIRERQDIIEDLVPKSEDADLRDSLVENLRALFSLGITSIVQAQDTVAHYPEWQRVYKQYQGGLPRAAVQLKYEDADTMKAFGKKSGDGDHYLRVGPIKIFADGGFTGPTAYTKAPYVGEATYRGKLMMSEAELAALLDEVHQAGWQMGIHAIGDAAIELVVESLADTLARNPRPDHRHYLNHFTVMPNHETMALMAANDISITQQPNFTYTLEGRYKTNLDGTRLHHNNPMATPMSLGVHTALSSDILPLGPMVGIYAAVTRRGMSGTVYGAEEAISAHQAITAYTLKGAYLTREESIKGSISVGKLADLVVLSADPTKVNGDSLIDIEVLRTYLGGQLVYEQEKD